MDVTILTPERQLPSHQADSVIVPAHDGLRGFLPGHAAMVCQLGSGKLTLDLGSAVRVVYVLDGGIVQVHNDHITVLAESAKLLEDISAPKLIEELERLDSATYSDDLSLTQAKVRAHWLRTQLQSAGKDVPSTKQV